MPAGSKKSGTFRKVFKRTPGGKTVIHYEKRKPKTHKCAVCEKELIGIPRLRDSKMQTIAKTKKRPQRPYGGYLCNACAKRRIIEESRS
ncbi:MAG: 50S ribosomal protein L34e [Nanoarchaeota archaeon]|nr:50S ribosomal protein L34e [Nanoarchaeota archaeon]MBU1269152.1 50S ribosomal protein L34e [Nanoarchaeota archaeon]MBU1605114.1 50S ribosomal protein L34e [Nanoarchaeota archaeon]MBU2442795.1 50S ribosomal protein L34e [Nanoarchaeota archaeon]